MNYKEINQAILEGRDIDERKVTKNREFYHYLLNNRVANYYSSRLSSRRTRTEEKILARAKAFGSKFLKTMNELAMVAAKAETYTVVFKTIRTIDEPVDGDIDLLLNPRDFKRFLVAMQDAGYSCFEDEPGKAKCEKLGRCIVEPHSAVSWRTITALSADEILQSSLPMEPYGSHVRGASVAFEETAQALELFFSPEYVDLHKILTAAKHSRPQGAEARTNDFVEEYRRIVHSEGRIYDQKFPYFVPNRLFLKRLYGTVNLRQLAYILTKNTYWQLRYRTFSKLPFTHDWGL